MKAGLALSAAMLMVTSPSAAGEPSRPLDVTASCEHRPAKGRVVCDVEAEIAEGRIAWADVVIVEVPSFAAPLRSRVALADARTRTERRVRIPVALVATALGRGKVIVRVRAVVCTEGPRGAACSPKTGTATTDLVVGTDVQG
jgi:hypothetical protein